MDLRTISIFFVSFSVRIVFIRQILTSVDTSIDGPRAQRVNNNHNHLRILYGNKSGINPGVGGGCRPTPFNCVLLNISSTPITHPLVPRPPHIPHVQTEKVGGGGGGGGGGWDRGTHDLNTIFKCLWSYILVVICTKCRGTCTLSYPGGRNIFSDHSSNPVSASDAYYIWEQTIQH